LPSFLFDTILFADYMKSFL